MRSRPRLPDMDEQVPERVDLRPEARRDERGRIVLRDDRAEPIICVRDLQDLGHVLVHLLKDGDEVTPDSGADGDLSQPELRR